MNSGAKRIKAVDTTGAWRQLQRRLPLTIHRRCSRVRLRAFRHYRRRQIGSVLRRHWRDASRAFLTSCFATPSHKEKVNE